MKIIDTFFISNSRHKVNYKEKASLVILFIFTAVTSVIALYDLFTGQMQDFYITGMIVFFNLILSVHFIKYRNTIVIGTAIFWMMGLASIFMTYEHHFNSMVIFLILSPLIAFLILPLRLALVYVGLFELMAAYLFYWGYQHYSNNTLIFSLNGLVDYIFATLYLIFFWLFYHVTIEKTMNKMQKLTEEKTMLLQELHHRVKNNFNMMIAMVDMQYQHSDQLDTQAFIHHFKQRIESIVMAHELLYADTMPEQVDLQTYIPQLASHIQKGCTQECDVEIRYHIDPVTMSIDALIYFGVILNELITNALKYAFDDRAGRIDITIQKDHSEMYLLHFCDDGKGFSDHEQKRGFGMMLIEMAVQQLTGTFHLENRTEGLCYTITVKG